MEPNTHFTLPGKTAVHGAEAAARGTKDVFHGLKEGSNVAVHYMAKGTVETAEEVDHIGKDGLKAADVTLPRVNRGAKRIAVKAASGTEETYRLTWPTKNPWPSSTACAVHNAANADTRVRVLAIMFSFDEMTSPIVSDYPRRNELFSVCLAPRIMHES